MRSTKQFRFAAKCPMKNMTVCGRLRKRPERPAMLPDQRSPSISWNMAARLDGFSLKMAFAGRLRAVLVPSTKWIATVGRACAYAGYR